MADVVDFALAQASAAKANNAVLLPTDERGFSGEAVYYTVDGELFDYRRPTVRELEGMYEHDPYARAIQNAVTLPLIAAKPELDKPQDDKGQTDFVKNTLFGTPHDGGMETPFHTLRQQMCAAIFTRRSFFELVWQVQDSGPYSGKQSYRKVAFRPGSTCRVLVDNNGDFAGFVQEGFFGPRKPIKQFFDQTKAFVVIHDSSMRPMEGRSPSDTMYAQYVDKLKVKRLWFSHLQDRALGSLKGTYTGNDPQGPSKLAKDLRALRGGGIWVHDQFEDAEFMEARESAQDFENALQFLNAEMGMSFLAMFLGLSHQRDRGSWALSKDQSDFFLQSLEAYNQEHADQLTSGLIQPLVEYNYGPDASVPQARFPALNDDQTQMALDLWKTLMTAPASRASNAVLEAIQGLALTQLGLKADDIIAEANKEAPELAPLPPTAGGAQAPLPGMEAHTSQPQASQGNGRSAEGTPPAFAQSVAALHQTLAAATNGASNV